jgi:isopentenyldiphosphate isomerase
VIQEEFLDIVDEKDQVLGTASRSEIYQKLLSHRIVHVLVFDSKGRLALQQRSAKNKFLPLYWGTSSGGHVRAGESYQEAGTREMREELNLFTPIEFLYQGIYIDLLKSGFKKQIWVFKTYANGPFKIDPAEGENIHFFSLVEIQEMLEKKEKFMPELLWILENNFDIK